MKFGIGDREYEFDGELTVDEAMLIFDKTGLGINEFDPALNKGNPYAIAVFAYILKRRANEAVRWQDMGKIAIRTFRQIIDEPTDVVEAGESEQAAGKAKGNPTTSANGRTRKPASTNT